MINSLIYSLINYFINRLIYSFIDKFNQFQWLNCYCCQGPHAQTLSDPCTNDFDIKINIIWDTSMNEILFYIIKIKMWSPNR